MIFLRALEIEGLCFSFRLWAVIRFREHRVIKFGATLTFVLFSFRYALRAHSCPFDLINFAFSQSLVARFVFRVHMRISLSFFLPSSEEALHVAVLFRKFKLPSWFCVCVGVCLSQCFAERMTLSLWFIFSLFFFGFCFFLNKKNSFIRLTLWLRIPTLCVWRPDLLWQNIETTFPFRDMEKANKQKKKMLAASAGCMNADAVECRVWNPLPVGGHLSCFCYSIHSILHFSLLELISHHSLDGVFRLLFSILRWPARVYPEAWMEIKWPKYEFSLSPLLIVAWTPSHPT